ncbi:TlpA family protein disulfide reductase [Pseudogemmobacter sonorensis]|uniref:TlpA family protein disulfide reductase n=1 Tax=Pseudogemmobacter sonorensis TaxID=2989681 RepID=UPI0036CC4231
MRKTLAVLYTALTLGANAALADGVAALREGDMKKLVLHEAPLDLPRVGLLTMEDAPASLADYRGRWVVLNFWATWCGPCREEMPSLDRLQAAMPDLVVLPVASGRNDLVGIRRFFDDAGITRLTGLRDPTGELSRAMSVIGLPLTVILDPQGREVARLIGDAEWDSASARAVLAALMAGG